MGSVAEELNFRLCLIVINLNVYTYMCLVATVLDSTAPETLVKLGNVGEMLRDRRETQLTLGGGERADCRYQPPEPAQGG